MFKSPPISSLFANFYDKTESRKVYIALVFYAITTNKLFIYSNFVFDFPIHLITLRIKDINLAIILVQKLQAMDPIVAFFTCSNSSDWPIYWVQLD